MMRYAVIRERQLPKELSHAWRALDVHWPRGEPAAQIALRFADGTECNHGHLLQHLMRVNARIDATLKYYT